jgi:PKD repeat protein
VASYAWTFGDGSTGTGARPSHTYAAAGTYTVGLTVTDNSGARGSTTRQVTVSAPGVVASDTFTRTVNGGWGQADSGGTWTLTTATSNFAVAGGVGTMQLVPSSGPSAYLLSTSARDVDLGATIGFDKAATGGGIFVSLVGRRTGTSDYRVKVRATATGTTAYLARTVSGAETALTAVDLPGVVVAPGTSLQVRLRLVGSGTTTLQAKVWPTGDPEPTAWTTTAADGTAALQVAGAVGLYTYLSSSATNSPVTVSFDDVRADTA